MLEFDGARMASSKCFVDELARHRLVGQKHADGSTGLDSLLEIDHGRSSCRRPRRMSVCDHWCRAIHAGAVAQLVRAADS